MPEGLAVFTLPEPHRRRLRTSNPMERAVQEELKRRTAKVSLRRAVLPLEGPLILLSPQRGVPPAARQRHPRRDRREMGLRHQGLHQVGMPGCVTRSQQNFQTSGCVISAAAPRHAAARHPAPSSRSPRPRPGSTASRHPSSAAAAPPQGALRPPYQPPSYMTSVMTSETTQAKASASPSAGGRNRAVTPDTRRALRLSDLGQATGCCAPARSSTSTARMVGRWRAISCQLSPSSQLAKTEPLFVPK